MEIDFDFYSVSAMVANPILFTVGLDLLVAKVRPRLLKSLFYYRWVWSWIFLGWWVDHRKCSFAHFQQIQSKPFCGQDPIKDLLKTFQFLNGWGQWVFDWEPYHWYHPVLISQAHCFTCSISLLAWIIRCNRLLQRLQPWHLNLQKVLLPNFWG